MWPSIINVVAEAGALAAGWLRLFGKDARYPQAKKASPIEDRTTFWQRILKRQERTAFTVYGVVRCMRTVRIYGETGGIAAWPLSDGDG